jgi:asparagine synthase (glutamine-hydrolysing)
MCGIAGMYLPQVRDVTVDWQRVGDMIAHRGPDGDGLYRSDDRRYTAIFRRLAIIDLETGNQPLLGVDGTVLTGNGEIYNYQELRRDFAGYPYRTSGDMEAVLAAAHHLGDGYVDVLNGMYALALYRPDTHTLELVRDRMGVKPLYWARIPGGGLIYASEIKPILASGLIDAEVDEDAVNAYLQHGYVPCPDTFLKGIHKLRPGERLTARADGSIDVRTYWSPRPAKDLPETAPEIAGHLSALLDDSVRMQLRSDVPVGVLLSGGLDSGLLVALAARRQEDAIKTFTVSFDGADYDESPLAESVARQYGTDHTALRVGGGDADDNLMRLAWFAEEPLNDAALLPNYLIEKALGAHVTVALNGTGGDELFAGYGRYFQLPVERRYLRLPAWLRDGVIEPAVGMVSPMRAWQLSRAELFEENRGAYLNAHSTHFPPPLRAVLGNRMPVGPSAQARAADAYAAAHGGPLQTVGLAADLGTYLVDDLLTLLDRTSMAVSVEGRVPFLDHRLVEAALAVPPAIRTPGGVQKGLERDIAAAHLPSSVLNAPKQGFVSPVTAWMTGNIGEAAVRILTRKETLDRGWWTAGGIHSLAAAPARHAYRLYSLLMLELAVRQFTEMPLSASAPNVSLRDFAHA